eukprot:452738-Rhodomonas_salina.1
MAGEYSGSADDVFDLEEACTQVLRCHSLARKPTAALRSQLLASAPALPCFARAHHLPATVFCAALRFFLASTLATAWLERSLLIARLRAEPDAVLFTTVYGHGSAIDRCERGGQAGLCIVVWY